MWFNPNVMKRQKYFLRILDNNTNVEIYRGVRREGYLKNIYLNLCSKGFRSLEQHDGEQLMTELNFLGELTLTH